MLSVMARTCSLLAIALICGKPHAAHPVENTAPPGAATPASGAGSAKKCYADPDAPESNCEGIGTCLALCENTLEECSADCRAQTCPEVPCPPGT